MVSWQLPQAIIYRHVKKQYITVATKLLSHVIIKQKKRSVCKHIFDTSHYQASQCRLTGRSGKQWAPRFWSEIAFDWSQLELTGHHDRRNMKLYFEPWNSEFVFYILLVRNQSRDYIQRQNLVTK
jgi:hypothetical protein